MSGDGLTMIQRTRRELSVWLKGCSYATREALTAHEHTALETAMCYAQEKAVREEVIVVDDGHGGES